MTTPADGPPSWNPLPQQPQDPEFYRRVLDYFPSPVLVVDPDGNAVYANQALLQLGGWDHEQASRSIMDHIHVDDREPLIEAFFEIVASPGARVLGSRPPFAEIYFRMIAADGSVIPVELIGNGGIRDEAVGGMIYEIRSAHQRSLVQRVLAGLSDGATMQHLVTLIATMICSPPLDLKAVVLETTGDTDRWIVTTTTSPVLAEVFRSSTSGLDWETATHEPGFAIVGDLPTRLKETLSQAGFQDVWFVEADSPLTTNRLRIIAAAPSHHVSRSGPRQRLITARQLGAAVLLRSEVGVLFQHAAAEDELTGLPNRAAFYRQAEAHDQLSARAAIQVDIDGLQSLNRRHGDISGDAALQIVADRLQATCSPHPLGRTGSDEFVIFLPDDGTGELSAQAEALATAVFSATNDTIVIAGQPVALSTSIGLAIVTGGISTDQLFTLADAATQDAKVAGGGQIRRHSIEFG